MKYAAIALLAALGACSKPAVDAQQQTPAVDGQVVLVKTTMVPAQIEATGTAQPIAQATISTKLMAAVTEVRVKEGDRVVAGQILAVLDARDLAAKDAQISAGIAAAEAMQREALTHAQRMRTLYAQDAAPKAQLDAAEAMLARADAGVASARAGAAEIRSVRDYSLIRAPFDGVVTRRFVDPGAFAAPGAPLITVEDARQLRVRATANPESVRNLKRGMKVEAVVEDATATGVIEGVVPTGSSLYTVNVIVRNHDGAYLPGSAATILLPAGTRNAIMIPETGIRRQGDLTGVMVEDGGRMELRWVKLGRRMNDDVEVLAGLRDGDKIVVPQRLAGAR